MKMKNLKIKTLAGAAVAILLAGNAHAQSFSTQSEYGAVAGDWELTLDGRGANDRKFDSGSGGAAVSLGYYLADQWEISVQQGLSIIKPANASSSVAGLTLLTLDYYFPLKRWRPFIGASFGGIYGEDVRNSFLAGPEAGVKFYVQPKTFIEAKIDYQWLFRSGGSIDDRIRDGRFGYSLGIGFNF